MLWRVGRDLRQLSQAAHRVLERLRAPPNPLCVIAQPLHSTRRLLWPPAVALKLKHSHASTAGHLSSSTENNARQEADDPSMQSGLRTGGSKEGADGSDVGPPAPPPEVLSALNNLFARHPTRCTMEDIRQCGSLYVVPPLRHPTRGPALVLHLLESNGPDLALWALRLASEVGQTFTATFYGQLAALLVSRKRWRDVLRVGHLARRSLGHTTTALLNWRLQALMEIPHFVPVEEALALFEKEGVEPSRLTYHILVSMHLRNHDLPSALAALSAMESAGFPVTSMTCAIVMLNYRSFGLTPSIKAQALDALRTTTNTHVASAILNGLVQLMLDAGDIPGVVAILSSLMPAPEDPSSGLGVGFILEDGAVDTGPESAADSLTPRRDIVNVTTYNILLEYLADQGDLPRGIRVLQEMRAAEICPNSRTTAALAHLYFATGQTNDALHVIAGTLVDLPAAVAALHRLGFTASLPPEQPIPPPTRPTIEIFNTLLLGTLRDHGLKGLHAVLSMMRIAEVEADATTLTILLSHKHRREIASPRELIRIVRILMSQGVTPTMQHLHALLGSLLRQEREGTRARGWHVYPSANIANTETPDSIAGELLGNAYSHPTAGMTFPTRRKHANLLRPVVQSLTDRGVQSDRVTFGMRIKQDAVVRHDMEAAKQAFRAMVDSGVQPNIYHYAALMEGHAEAGDMDAAEGTFRAAMEAGLRPNVKAHTILIFGYARLARPSMAVKAFRKMVAQGIRPDVPAVDALVSAFFRAKAYGMARRVLLRLWPQVAPLEDKLLDAPLKELAVAFRGLHVANERPRERLTSEEQRSLRGAIREIAKSWKDVTTKGLKGRKNGSARAVVTRTPQYTKALGG